MDDLEMIAEKFPTNGIESASIVVCEGSFTLEGIDTEIRFRIHRDITAVMPGEPYGFELSHWIHTPQQAGPYTCGFSLFIRRLRCGPSEQRCHIALAPPGPAA